MMYNMFYRGKTSQKQNPVMGATKEEILKIIAKEMDDKKELKVKIIRKNL